MLEELDSRPKLSAPQRFLGTLVVVVIKARNLKNCAKLKKQDPFVSIRIGNEAYRTQVDIRGGQAPIWDEEFRFKINDRVSENIFMKVSVFHDESKELGLIGDCRIPLLPILQKGEQDAWHDIHMNEKFVGEIYIESTYYASNIPIGISLPPIKARTSTKKSVGRDLPKRPTGLIGPSESPQKGPKIKHQFGRMPDSRDENAPIVPRHQICNSADPKSRPLPPLP